MVTCRTRVAAAPLPQTGLNIHVCTRSRVSRSHVHPTLTIRQLPRRCAAQTGHGRLPPLLLRAVALLFEESSDRVCYGALVAFVGEQEAALEARDVEDALRR
jgi:hypothetical protein